MHQNIKKIFRYKKILEIFRNCHKAGYSQRIFRKFSEIFEKTSISCMFLKFVGNREEMCKNVNRTRIIVADADTRDVFCVKLVCEIRKFCPINDIPKNGENLCRVCRFADILRRGIFGKMCKFVKFVKFV